MKTKGLNIFISYISALIVVILSFTMVFFLMINTSERMMDLKILTSAYQGVVVQKYTNEEALDELLFSEEFEEYRAAVNRDAYSINWHDLEEVLKRISSQPENLAEEFPQLYSQMENLKKEMAKEIRTEWRAIKFLFFFFILLILLLLIAIIISLRDRLKKDVQDNLEEYYRKYLIMQLEKERNLVSYHLHDDIAQSMVFLKTYLESDNPDYLRSKRERAVELTGEILQNIRNLSQSLRAPTMNEGGFDNVLKGLCEDMNGTCSLDIHYSFISTNSLNPGSESFLHIYRITQELVNNGCHHSKGNRIDLKFLYSHPYLILNYSDDGIGFDPTLLEKKGSMGLKGIDYRCRLLGGDILFSNGPEGGAAVRIRIPISETEDTI